MIEAADYGFMSPWLICVFMLEAGDVDVGSAQLKLYARFVVPSRVESLTSPSRGSGQTTLCVKPTQVAPAFELVGMRPSPTAGKCKSAK